MQIKFLKQIVEQVAGVQAVQIVDLLSDKKDINEFIIAKKLKITINQTRNLLYRLSHLGILSSIRKKDKRKGWYIYFWTLNILKSLEILEENFEKEIKLREGQLKDKKSIRYYKCKICGREVSEEAALLSEFTCAECGEVYELSNTLPYVDSITKEINRMKKELSFIKQEREKEQQKQNQKLGRKIKKVEKDKKEKRAQARAKKVREKKRLGKKVEKAKAKAKRKRKRRAKRRIAKSFGKKFKKYQGHKKHKKKRKY